MVYQLMNKSKEEYDCFSTAFSNFKANLSSDFISNVLNLCYNKTALLKRDVPRFDIFLAFLKNFMV